MPSVPLLEMVQASVLSLDLGEFLWLSKESLVSLLPQEICRTNGCSGPGLHTAGRRPRLLRLSGLPIDGRNSPSGSISMAVWTQSRPFVQRCSLSPEVSKEFRDSGRFGHMWVISV